MLALQLYLSLSFTNTTGLGFIAGLITYFSFFTILGNIFVATVFTAPWLALGNRLRGFLTSPNVQAGVAVYIVFVGLGYSLLLRHVWNPEGMQKIADAMLHDVMPVVYFLYWLVFVPKGQLRWRIAPRWLVLPAAYFAYALLRGALAGQYPYYFLDVTVYGYQRVFATALVFLIAVLVLGLLIIAIDGAMNRLQPSQLHTRSESTNSDRE